MQMRFYELKNGKEKHIKVHCNNQLIVPNFVLRFKDLPRFGKSAALGVIFRLHEIRKPVL
jgi:hypothetical protein